MSVPKVHRIVDNQKEKVVAKLKYNLTEFGMSRRLVDMFGENIRYCHESKQWFIFDGCRWKPDNSGQMMRFAREVVKAIHFDGKRQSKQELKSIMLKYAYRIENIRSLKNLVELAQSEPEVALEPDTFDKHNMHLCVQNGRIDFTNMNFRENKPEDMNTRLAKLLS